MTTDANNQAGDVQPKGDEGGEQQPTELDTLKAQLAERDAEITKRDETIGSLKRENKDLKKAKETPADPPPKPDDSLSSKAYLAARGITEADEVELALESAKKWGVEIDKIVDDEDFKAKLERVRTAKTNAAATEALKGGQGGDSQAKLKPEYWLAKGHPPSREEVPDRKARAAIARAFIKQGENNGKTFYND